MKNWKTYKIDLNLEQEAFLHTRKAEKGIAISYQLTEALKMYIEAVEKKEGRDESN